MLPFHQVLGRLALATLLGALVGAERERHERAAGLRTHALVGVGSCLFMLVSAFGFADILDTHGVALDPSRIAAQVASGIGFLGAGTIIFRRDTVRGLTTAASVWASAAIGLAVGSGLWAAGLAATGLTLGVLAGLKPLERRFFTRRGLVELTVVMAPNGATVDALRSVVADAGLLVERVAVRVDPTGGDRVKLSAARGAAGHEVVDRLRALGGVRAVKLKGL